MADHDGIFYRHELTCQNYIDIKDGPQAMVQIAGGPDHNERAGFAMATFLDSTTAPADHRALLRSAVPVPTPDLTAETVAMLDAIPEAATNTTRRKELYEILHPETRQHVAGGHAKHGSASANLAFAENTAASTGRSERAVQRDAAQALHMRRALEGALDHGTALLAALGLPRLMEHGSVPIDPAAIGDALDTAIATLDALDAPGADLEDDGTAEPWLGWIDGKPVSSDSHDDREAEDDDEPILGAPERHPSCNPWSSGRDNTGRQTHWSDGRNGSANDGEAEAGYDLPEGDDERCGSDDVDKEPWLGAPENHDRAPDQEHWAESGYSHCSDVEIGEDESQTDKGLPFDVRQANEAAAREAGRQAMAMRRRKDLVTEENEVQFGNLRMIDGWTVREMGAAHG